MKQARWSVTTLSPKISILYLNLLLEGYFDLVVFLLRFPFYFHPAGVLQTRLLLPWSDHRSTSAAREGKGNFQTATVERTWTWIFTYRWPQIVYIPSHLCFFCYSERGIFFLFVQAGALHSSGNKHIEVLLQVHLGLQPSTCVSSLAAYSSLFWS